MTATYQQFAKEYHGFTEEKYENSRNNLAAEQLVKIAQAVCACIRVFSDEDMPDPDDVSYAIFRAYSTETDELRVLWASAVTGFVPTLKDRLHVRFGCGASCCAQEAIDNTVEDLEEDFLNGKVTFEESWNYMNDRILNLEYQYEAENEEWAKIEDEE